MAVTRPASRNDASSNVPVGGLGGLGSWGRAPGQKGEHHQRVDDDFPNTFEVVLFHSFFSTRN
jgi:hypothetical protein